MRDEFKRSRNPDVGSPAYLISKAWVENYKMYVHYDALRTKREPTQATDHCKVTHPGKILNADFLELDEKTFLHGTNFLKSFEANWVDRYVKENASEGMQYEVVPEAMWSWLRDKYECDYEIKRFYHKGSSSFYTSLDIDLVKVPVFLLHTGDLREGKVTTDPFSV
jgi:hypothetical protein